MKCGRPISKEDEEFCENCKKRVLHFDAGVSVWLHKPPVNTSIYHFKFHKQPQFVKYYEKAIGKEILEKICRWSPDMILPVPLHKSRLRDRGFNQAMLLAEMLERKLQEYRKIKDREDVSKRCVVRGEPVSFCCTERPVSFCCTEGPVSFCCTEGPVSFCCTEGVAENIFDGPDIRKENRKSEKIKEIEKVKEPEKDRESRGIVVSDKILVRTQKTKHQKELTPERRVANLQNAFDVCEEEAAKYGGLENKTVLLVDDIYTTGSTVSELARVCKKYGAARVYFFSLSIGEGNR